MQNSKLKKIALNPISVHDNDFEELKEIGCGVFARAYRGYQGVQFPDTSLGALPIVSTRSNCSRNRSTPHAAPPDRCDTKQSFYFITECMNRGSQYHAIHTPEADGADDVCFQDRALRVHQKMEKVTAGREPTLIGLDSLAGLKDPKLGLSESALDFIPG